MGSITKATLSSVLKTTTSPPISRFSTTTSTVAVTEAEQSYESTEGCPGAASCNNVTEVSVHFIIYNCVAKNVFFCRLWLLKIIESKANYLQPLLLSW
jgi:hypothetical protein